MRTVHEVSALTGVSIRTLQYYDKIGLLHPTEYTEAGYRLYDDAALETLQQILLFRELEFPLKDIKEIIGSPDFDRSKALGQQIELLKLKKTYCSLCMSERIRSGEGFRQAESGNRDRRSGSGVDTDRSENKGERGE